MIPEGFHFLRPIWLFAALPIATLLWAGLRLNRGADAWKRVVDAHLLRHLVGADFSQSRRWPLAALALAWFAAMFALAGPTWERLPQPIGKSPTPTVVALSLARSMDQGDITPSRLERARFELAAIAERVRGDQLGLIVYTNVPFVAVPLTDDVRVVEELIPLLRTDLMPAPGRRLDRAIEEASALIEGAGGTPGRILILADGADDVEAAVAAAETARGRGHRVSVIGLGTTGAAVAPLDEAGLTEIASAGGGRFMPITSLASELGTLVGGAPTLATFATGSLQETQAFTETPDWMGDRWRDTGIWLVLVPLALAPLAFRRGWLAALAFFITAGGATPAEASLWNDLWSTPDQQGANALSADKPAEAAELFEDPAWRAAAQYQAGDYESAIKSYQDESDADARFNLGNALARNGKLTEAIEAWDEVIKANSADADARFNRDLVQKLLEEQKDQQKEQGEDGENSPESKDGEGGEPKDQQQGEAGDPSDEQQKAADQKAGNPEASDSKGGEKPAEEQKDAAAEESNQKKDDEAEQKDRADKGTGEPKEESAEQRAEKAQEHAKETAAERAAAEADDTLGKGIDAALDDKAKDKTGEALASASLPPPIDEATQQREQRLREIPSDPAGLLRARIHRHYAEEQAMLRGGYFR